MTKRMSGSVCQPAVAIIVQGKGSDEQLAALRRASDVEHAAVDDIVELDQWQLTPAGREALERMHARLHPEVVLDTSQGAALMTVSTFLETLHSANAVQGTVSVLFHCSCCGGVWRRTYGTQTIGRRVTYHRNGRVVSLRREALCCACGLHGRFAIVRGRVSNRACDDACHRARNPVCRCQCGGLNHGVAHDLASD